MKKTSNVAGTARRKSKRGPTTLQDLVLTGRKARKVRAGGRVIAPPEPHIRTTSTSGQPVSTSCPLNN